MTTAVLALAKKDLKAIYTNPMFYVLLGLCCCLWGLFFSIQVFSFVQKSYQMSSQTQVSGLNIYHDLMGSYLVVVHYVLIFVVAALSLRFFTEEKKAQTFPVLLTSPMTSWQIVMAKWMAAKTILFSMLLVSAIFPLSLAFYMSLPLKLMAFGYLGLFVVLCIYMAAALLASALTDSAILSVVLTLVFCLLLLLMGLGAELTDSLSLQYFFRFLALDPHFSQFRSGIFNLSSLFYLISWSALMLLLTERVIESHRWR